MKRVVIKNVGVVKEACLELKKLTILIGAQSTGKSTIAKIVCYCTWVEKEIFLNASSANFEKENYFEENLVNFHKMKGFVSEQSVIEYETDVMYFKFEQKKFAFRWKDVKEYKRTKTLYIPAERNIIAVIPNWFEVNLERNNTRSFLADWNRVRKHYTQDKPLKILNKASYYHNPNTLSDRLVFKDAVEINIDTVSSGFQTLTPLLALFDYYSNDYYSEELWRQEQSVEILEKWKNQIVNFKISENKNEFFIDIIRQFIKENIEDRKFDLSERDKSNKTILEEFLDLSLNEFLRKFNEPKSTAFFIEEPELNLYPKSQRLLVNDMMATLQTTNHSLFLTTHSPYILTSINNLLFAAQVGKQNKSEADKIISENKWLPMEEVAAWKINEETYELQNLMDEELQMLKAEEIDEVSSVINEEFDKLFDLYNPELDEVK